MSATLKNDRTALVRGAFPRGVPRLWVPPVTHYRADGSLDAERIRLHLEALAPHVGGLLVPGSTGDGWELPRDMKLALLDIALPIAARLGLPVLAGVLEPTLEGMLSFAEDLGPRARLSPVVGIVACAPSGADQAEAAIEDALARVLALGLPTAIYQLPQVTGNRIASATAARLASRYANFFMIKDSSGEDGLAGGEGLDGVFLVRGAELGYRRWLKPRGPYDGFLLSTANWLAAELAVVAAGGGDADLDARIDAAVTGAFELVPGYPTGNAFGNSAKLMDHVMAHGERASSVPGPFSRDGRAFPRELVARAVELAAKTGILPGAGYAATAARA